MSKRFLVCATLFMASILLTLQSSFAQCSICTKTAQQLGEKPAEGLNGAILYLAFLPLALIGAIGYRWWRSNRDNW